MVKITPLSLSVINRIKLKRLSLGISAENLSLTLKRSHGYILTVENNELKTQYPPHEWPKIAQALNCTIHDLLPEKTDTEIDELVEKRVLDLSIEDDLRIILLELIRIGFFYEEKTIDAIAGHLIMRDDRQLVILSEALKSLQKDGLINSEENSTFKVNG